MKQFLLKNLIFSPADRRNLQKALFFNQLSTQTIGLQKILFIFLFHIVLALIIRQYEVVAAAYCIAVVVIGLYIAMSSKTLEKVAYVCAYIAGAEVLWRMTDGSLFWEIGKYGTIFILSISIFKTNKTKIPVLVFFYFLLLVPSIIITTQEMTIADARGQISFNLSGPLAILMCAWFFSSVAFTSINFQKLLLAFLGPVIGVGSLVLYGVLTTRNIVFTTESNFATSGGFGPNQVGSILGLGALFAFLFLLIKKTSVIIKLLFCSLFLLLSSLSLITFSRSGIMLLFFCLSICGIFLIKSQSGKVKIVLIVLFLVFSFIFIYPAIDDYTNGMLSNRYTEETTTNRGKIAENELEVWTNNPIFGVGVGQMRQFRLGEANVAAHTEYTRVLSEHGLLGLLALSLLIIAAGSNILYSKNAYIRAFKAALISWMLLYMFINALRIVAPAFVFGISFAFFLMEEDISPLINYLRSKNKVSNNILGSF